MSGDKPGLCDVNAYMNVWYVRAHLPNTDEMLAEFGNTRAWEARMRARRPRPQRRTIDLRRARHRRQAPRQQTAEDYPIPTIPMAASPVTGSR